MIWNRHILVAVMAAMTTSCRQDTRTHGYMYASKGFVLQHKGRTRAALKMLKGHPVLELYDSDGKTTRASLSVINQGVYLRFTDANGVARLFMKTEADGFASLALLAPNTPRIAMGYKPATQLASLQIWDHLGNNRVALDATNKAAAVKLHGTSINEALLSLILLYQPEKAFLMILNDRGKILFGAPRKRR